MMGGAAEAQQPQEPAKAASVVINVPGRAATVTAPGVAVATDNVPEGALETNPDGLFHNHFHFCRAAVLLAELPRPDNELVSPRGQLPQFVRNAFGHVRENELAQSAARYYEIGQRKYAEASTVVINVPGPAAGAPGVAVATDNVPEGALEPNPDGSVNAPFGLHTR